jgi:anti-anti-sigma factor
VSVVALLGEHDLASAPDVRAALARCLEEGKSVVVDVSETLFMDLAILRVLKQAREAAQEGKSLVVQFGTAPAVRRLMEATALLDHFPHGETREKAVRLAAGHEESADA